VVKLCDAELYTVIGSDDGSISSKCWWMPYERLVAERVNDDMCPLGAPSKAADIYAVAMIIVQVGVLYDSHLFLA